MSKFFKVVITILSAVAVISFVSLAQASLLLHDFDTSVEGWSMHWGSPTTGGNTTGPTQVETPSYDGNGSIEYASTFTHGYNFGSRSWYNTPLDLSTYDYISARVRTPDTSEGAWMKIQIYARTAGSGVETWAINNVEGNLTAGEWYQPKLYISEISGTTDGDPTQIQSIGILVYSWDKDYSGTVHFDEVTAVPEPSTALLLGIFATSLFGIPSLRRKRK